MTTKKNTEWNPHDYFLMPDVPDIQIDPLDPTNPNAGMIEGQKIVPHGTILRVGDDESRNPSEASSLTMDDEHEDIAPK